MKQLVGAGVVALAATLCAGSLAPARLAAQQEAQPPARVVVGNVQISGNSRVSAAQIQADLGVQAGDTVGYAVIQAGLHKLWASGQFKDVKVYSDSNPKDASAPILLRVVVEELPILGALQFNGLENIRASTVRDTAGLHVGRPLTEEAVTRAESMVRSLLAQKGYRVRSVAHHTEPIPQRPGEERLVFDVQEGQRVAIAQVGFDGNHAFSSAQLAKVLDTKAEGFLWFHSGTFDEAKLRRDLRDKLPSFYGENGYIDFAVLGDTLIVDQQSGKARLVIRLDEGPQYRLGDFTVRGNRAFPADQLKSYFEAGRGGLLGGLGISIGGSSGAVRDSVFDEVAFNDATAEVERLYSNEGYLYRSVQQIIDRVPPTDSTPPVVNVGWDILEGEPAYIRRVNITGNTYTHEDVIRGQLNTLPGDVYSEDRLLQSYRRISSLGFFETPVPLPKIDQVEGGTDVDITFDVKEKQTGSVNFGTSLGGVTGVAGFIGYDQPNLFGKAKAGHLRWEFGKYSNNFEASYSDPAIGDSRLSGSLSLFSSSDRFFTFSEGRRKRTGIGLQVGIPAPWDRFYSTLVMGYSISRTTYQNFDPEQASSLFSLPPGLQSTVTLGLRRSTLDHPMFPTVGSNVDLSAALNGGILGGDGTFQKYTVSGSWYVPVGHLGGSQPGSRPIRFTLGMTAEAGAIFGDASRFPFDRFWMGGVQFGTPLRGYDETTITPLGYIARGATGVPLTDRFGDSYLRLSAEYAVRLNDNISVSAFYDAGNVWLKPAEIDPTRLFRGAGLGLTLVTPFGPLGLDYAYGFDKIPPGWQLHFKFGQGMGF